MAGKPSARGRLASIPANHDALGAPNLRDQQGGPNGETSFRQIAPSSSSMDVTQASPVNVSGGNLKVSPSAGL